MDSATLSSSTKSDINCAWKLPFIYHGHINLILLFILFDDYNFWYDKRYYSNTIFITIFM
jgi:hypothetical protein